MRGRITVIALVIAAASPGVAWSRPVAGDFVGTSAQGLAFKLTVAPDRQTLTLDVRWRCAGRSEPVNMFRVHGVPLAESGDFAWEGANVEDLGDGDEDRQSLRIAGREIGGEAIAGTWHADHEFYNGEGRSIDKRCSSADVAFEVRHRAGPPGTDAAGNLVTELEGQPSGLDMVVAGEGRTWLLQGSGPQSVLEVDPATGALAGRTRLHDVGFPMLAVGAGAAWVVASGGTPVRLTRIDARTGRVRRVAIPGTGGFTGFDVTAIAAGAGAVWLQNGNRVLRADPRSGRIVGSIRLTRERRKPFRLLCGRGTDDLAAGPRQTDRIAVGAGAVWVMSNCGPHASRFGWLLRIDPRSNRITRSIALHDAYAGLVAGREGVWALTQGPLRLTVAPVPVALQRISLRDGRPASTTPLPEGGVTSIALGAGSVWFTQLRERQPAAPAGMLRRLDPAQRRLTTVLELEEPIGVAVGEGAVWAFDSFARTLTRVRL
jgi:hypothetical protein